MSSGNAERQGGDLRDRGHPVRLDLSTCVNPYGPPDAVLAAVRDMPASAYRMHPYQAAGQIESAYAAHTGQPAGQFIASRGASDLIWSLAHHFEGKTIGLPLPSYTEFRRAFPQARLFGGGPATRALEVLAEAMRACDAVIVSNPHNPTGQVLQPSDLTEIASRHPASVLVVDESYIDFLPNAATVTMIGCGAGNVMVLRSPSKFYGLAGLRSGAAWTLHPLHARWRDRRTSWPVSAFAARALTTALAQTSWAATVRGTLARDTAWLEGRLARTGLAVTPGRLHFRLLTSPARQVTGLTEALDAGGVAVRVLPPAYGAGSPAVRISAPHHQHRPVLDAALGALGQPPQDPPARTVPTPPPTGPR